MCPAQYEETPTDFDTDDSTRVLTFNHRSRGGTPASHLIYEPGEEEEDMPTYSTPQRAPAGDTPHRGNANGAYENGYSTNGYELPPLQTYGNLSEDDTLDPINDDDPSSYDLVAPGNKNVEHNAYSLEKRSQALFSKEHLQVIFSEPSSLLSFTSFMGVHNPKAVPILVHYLDALKALRAIHYANAILQDLEHVDGLDFTSKALPPTKNEALEARATAAFDYLAKEVLPAYITYQYINVVSASITARISGMLSPHLREASEGLAEVFCLTDPSRQDNPIVFASEGLLICGKHAPVANLYRIQ